MEDTQDSPQTEKRQEHSVQPDPPAQKKAQKQQVQGKKPVPIGTSGTLFRCDS